MSHSESKSENGVDSAYNGFWLIIFGMLSIVVFFIAQAYWVTEPMAASRMSLGVLSKVDFFGYIMLGAAFAYLLTIKGLAGLSAFVAAGAFGVGMLYFSYYGAIEYAASQGPDLFVEAVVSELGCFPGRWIPVAEQHGLTLPTQDQLCGAKG